MLSSEYIYGTSCCSIYISVRAADEILPTSSVAFVLIIIIIIITHLASPPTTVFFNIYYYYFFSPFLRPIPAHISLVFLISSFLFHAKHCVFTRCVLSTSSPVVRRLLPSSVAVIVVFNIIEFNPDDAPWPPSSLPVPLLLLLLLLLLLVLALLILLLP